MKLAHHLSQFSHKLFTIEIFVNKEGHQEQINKGGWGIGGFWRGDVREEKCLTLFTEEAVEKRHHFNDPQGMTFENIRDLNILRNS